MLRFLTMFLVVAALAVFGANAIAGNGEQKGDCDRVQTQDPDSCDCDGFVDADGDGVCDNCGAQCNPDAPDDDGDGIPNGQDDDYVPPQDGSGKGAR